MTPYEWFASRAKGDSYFMGHMLREFQENRGMSNRELGGFLRASKSSLLSLITCRAPNPDEKSFADDIRGIAQFSSCDRDRLLLLVREVVAIKSLRTPQSQLSSTLLAARDRRRRGKEFQPE